MRRADKTYINWAEGVRFELTELIRLNSFQDCPNRPLWHPSAQLIHLNLASFSIVVYLVLFYRTIPQIWLVGLLDGLHNKQPTMGRMILSK